MASRDLKRSILSTQPKGRRRNPYLKIRAYQGLHDLNRGFQITLNNLERLDRLGIFQSDDLRTYRNMTEEQRALVNTRLLATLQDVEAQDAFRLQNLRLKWEAQFKEPTKKRH